MSRGSAQRTEAQRQGGDGDAYRRGLAGVDVSGRLPVSSRAREATRQAEEDKPNDDDVDMRLLVLAGDRVSNVRNATARLAIVREDGGPSLTPF